MIFTIIYSTFLFFPTTHIIFLSLNKTQNLFIRAHRFATARFINPTRFLALVARRRASQQLQSLCKRRFQRACGVYLPKGKMQPYTKTISIASTTIVVHGPVHTDPAAQESAVDAWSGKVDAALAELPIDFFNTLKVLVAMACLGMFRPFADANIAATAVANHVFGECFGDVPAQFFQYMTNIASKEFVAKRHVEQATYDSFEQWLQREMATATDALRLLHLVRTEWTRSSRMGEPPQQTIADAFFVAARGRPVLLNDAFLRTTILHPLPADVILAKRAAGGNPFSVPQGSSSSSTSTTVSGSAVLAAPEANTADATNATDTGVPLQGLPPRDTSQGVPSLAPSPASTESDVVYFVPVYDNTRNPTFNTQRASRNVALSAIYDALRRLGVPTPDLVAAPAAQLLVSDFFTAQRAHPLDPAVTKEDVDDIFTMLTHGWSLNSMSTLHLDTFRQLIADQSPTEQDTIVLDYVQQHKFSAAAANHHLLVANNACVGTLSTAQQRSFVLVDNYPDTHVNLLTRHQEDLLQLGSSRGTTLHLSRSQLSKLNQDARLSADHEASDAPSYAPTSSSSSSSSASTAPDGLPPPKRPRRQQPQIVPAEGAPLGDLSSGGAPYAAAPPLAKASRVQLSAAGGPYADDILKLRMNSEFDFTAHPAGLIYHLLDELFEPDDALQRRLKFYKDKTGDDAIKKITLEDYATRFPQRPATQHARRNLCRAQPDDALTSLANAVITQHAPEMLNRVGPVSGKVQCDIQCTVSGKTCLPGEHTGFVCPTCGLNVCGHCRGAHEVYHFTAALRDLGLASTINAALQQPLDDGHELFVPAQCFHKNKKAVKVKSSSS